MRISRQTLAAAALAAAALLSGCDTKAREASRKEARRDACIATELLIQARNRAASLDTIMANAGGGTAGFAQSARQFAVAYDQYATARSAGLSLMDSAAYAKSRDDSLAWVNRAAKFSFGTAQPGSLADNVIAKYDADFAGAKANPDHPCNKPQEPDEDR
jgi:hypothetical protein